MLQKSGATEIMNKLNMCTFLLVRIFLLVLDKTPDDVVYGELGHNLLFIKATVGFIKYWLKFLMQPDNFYSRKAYKMLLALHNRGKTTCKHVCLCAHRNV